MEQRKLRLNEFKSAFNALETGTVWIDYLLLGFLYWLEEKVINVQVKDVVDEAIKEYETLQGELSPTHKESLPDLVSPVYRESPGEASESLPEMRLTAPWYIDSQKELNGR